MRNILIISIESPRFCVENSRINSDQQVNNQIHNYITYVRKFLWNSSFEEIDPDGRAPITIYLHFVNRVYFEKML